MRANEFANLGRSVSRECGGVPIRHARAGGYPVFRDASDGIENSRRTGYSAFAEYDGGGWSGPSLSFATAALCALNIGELGNPSLDAAIAQDDAESRPISAATTNNTENRDGTRALYH